LLNGCPRAIEEQAVQTRLPFISVRARFRNQPVRARLRSIAWRKRPAARSLRARAL
jgi:hypothetical protein